MRRKNERWWVDGREAEQQYHIKHLWCQTCLISVRRLVVKGGDLWCCSAFFCCYLFYWFTMASIFIICHVSPSWCIGDIPCQLFVTRRAVLGCQHLCFTPMPACLLGFGWSWETGKWMVHSDVLHWRCTSHDLVSVKPRWQWTQRKTKGYIFEMSRHKLVNFYSIFYISFIIAVSKWHESYCFMVGHSDWYVFPSYHDCSLCSVWLHNCHGNHL